MMDEATDHSVRNISAPREEWVFAVLLTGWVVVLHVVNLLHAGPLWRDEANITNFATMPIGPLLHNLHNDVFPLLFIVVTRLWLLAGLTGDFDCRLLGFIIGLGTLGALWYAARKLSGRPPLVTLVLYAINPLVIRTNDSLRPYGLAIAMTLLTAALVWNFVQNPGRGTFLGAMFLSILSAQCLYQDIFFLAAIYGAAGLVALGRKAWRTVEGIGWIGLATALSLLPYWNSVVSGQMSLGTRQREIQFGELRVTLLRTLQADGGWMALVWLLLGLAACALAFWRGAVQRRWNLLYCGAILISGSVLYLLFMLEMGLPPRPWYFPIFMAMAALMIDSILAAENLPWVSTGRILLGFLVGLTCLPACWAMVQIRQTNIDLVAAKLKESARAKDLIIVSEWYEGVALQRYLDTNLWTTVPPLQDVRVHRDDLIKRAMMTSNVLGPLLDQVRQTLSSGNRVWVAGRLPPSPANIALPNLAVFDRKLANPEALYVAGWQNQLAYLVKNHAADERFVDLPVPGGAPINGYENVPLTVYSGWHE